MTPDIIDILDESRIEVWKNVYYQFHDLIEKNRIYSKIPNRVMIRAYYSNEYKSNINRLITMFKNYALVPALILWKPFGLFEKLYYHKCYPKIKTLNSPSCNHFDYLFVLNTRDHTISAFPVIENLSVSKRILVVTFKSVYLRYKNDFDNFKNVDILLFENELKSLSLESYITIVRASDQYVSYLLKYTFNKEISDILKKDVYFLKLHLKEELIQYYLFKRIFESYSLKGVVAIVFTTAFEIAHDKNIPTYIIQHGIGGGGHLPYMCDYIFAYDEPTKEQLNKWTDNTVSILALGAPRYDYLNNKKKKYSVDMKTKYNIPASNKIITFVSEGEPYDNNLTLQSLKEMLSYLPESVSLVIKLHPRENLKESNIKKEIKNMFGMNEINRTFFIRNELDFYDVLANSDLVISTVSTGISEAIAMNILTLQVNFTGISYPENLDLSYFGGMNPISDTEILIKHVTSSLMNDVEYKKALCKQESLKKRMFMNIGLTGKLISDFIVTKS